MKLQPLRSVHTWYLLPDTGRKKPWKSWLMIFRSARNSLHTSTKPNIWLQQLHGDEWTFAAFGRGLRSTRMNWETIPYQKGSPPNGPCLRHSPSLCIRNSGQLITRNKSLATQVTALSLHNRNLLPYQQLLFWPRLLEGIATGLFVPGLVYNRWEFVACHLYLLNRHSGERMAVRSS